MTQVKGEGLHLVPIPYSGPLGEPDHLPSVLKAEDYPSLIPPGGRVDTVAVPAILAAFNWQPKTERYRKVEQFVSIFFDRLKSLQQPPFHPKWKEVVLSAPLKGWTRFPRRRNGSTGMPKAPPHLTLVEIRSSSWPRRPATPPGRTRERPRATKRSISNF